MEKQYPVMLWQHSVVSVLLFCCTLCFPEQGAPRLCADPPVPPSPFPTAGAVLFVQFCSSSQKLRGLLSNSWWCHDSLIWCHGCYFRKCHCPPLASNGSVRVSSVSRWTHPCSAHSSAVLWGLMELALGHFSFPPIAAQQTLAEAQTFGDGTAICMQQEMSAFHLCFDSNAAFLGKVRSVMLILSLVDSNHPFIEHRAASRSGTFSLGEGQEVNTDWLRLQASVPLPRAEPVAGGCGRQQESLQIFYF